MNQLARPLALVLLLTLSPSVRGSTFNQVDFTWQPVGNIGNAGDPTVRRGGASGFGSVDYKYEISKVPVTNAQYTEFLNATATASDPGGLYKINMKFNQGGIDRTGTAGNFTYVAKSGWENKPVNYVDVYDAMRFVNWISNGQPIGLQGIGTTESGSYTITQTGIDLNEIVRNPGAGVFLPTEDEWYKAAYHEPGASGDDYWRYPTRSDTVPSPGTLLPNGDMVPGANIANYQSGGILANVGTAGPLSESYYGVSDLAGHVWEWTESLITTDTFPNPPSSNPPSNGKWRAIMGGSRSAQITPLDHLASTFRHPEDPFDADCCRGFRLVRVVPEPSSLLAVLGLFAIAGTRRQGRCRGGTN